MRSEPRYARISVWALPVSLAATPGIDVSFSSSGYLDVSVRRVPSVHLLIQCTVAGGFPAGFPHSDICGSLDICSLPQLFAAYHVFRRLSVPRHPPCALSCLTSFPFLRRVCLERAFLPCIALHGRPFLSFLAAPGLPVSAFSFLAGNFRYLDVFLLLFFVIIRFSRCSLTVASHPWLQASLSPWIAGNSRLLYLFLFSGSFSFDLAATCSPIPSPVQYHRPLKS